MISYTYDYLINVSVTWQKFLMKQNKMAAPVNINFIAIPKCLKYVKINQQCISNVFTKALLLFSMIKGI